MLHFTRPIAPWSQPSAWAENPTGDISTGSIGSLLHPCCIGLQARQISTQRAEIQLTESEGMFDEGLTTGIIVAIKFRISGILVEFLRHHVHFKKLLRYSAGTDVAYVCDHAADGFDAPPFAPYSELAIQFTLRCPQGACILTVVLRGKPL